ncbi:MAG: glycosyltransferase family 9 protein [Candidatus Omnitrophica bacterium]|nr:glycosyltransferase family 9 protein [Candidatus Omnitrophota bacterium]
MPDTKTIAYFRNGLGNFILYTPALQALASVDPSGMVDVCLDGAWNDDRRPALEDLVGKMPFVQDVVNYPRLNLKKDHKVWFWTKHTYPSLGLNAFKNRSPHLDRGIAWRYSGQHEIDYYMDSVRRFYGFTGDTPKQHCPVDDSFTFDKKPITITLCNGSYGHLAPSKVWPGFLELAETLRLYYDCTIVKIGYNKELANVTQFDHDFVGKITLTQAAKVIKESSLFITTDTCNMHIGDALETPMVVLWGGSILTKNKPVNGRAKIISRGLKCQPCHDPDRFQTCPDFACLSGLGTGMVMAAVREALGD